MKITPALLQSAVGCTPELAARFAGYLDAACAHYQIYSAARMAAFLAQIGHESGSLRYVREIADGSAYEGRRDLGNVQPGDGQRYRGRGLIQVTGRSNYAQTAQRMRELDAPDFEDFPEALEEPRWAAWSAADWWHAHGCNGLADVGEYIAIGRLINRGSSSSTKPANGEADRIARWERAKAALATHAAPSPDQPAAADPGRPAAHPQQTEWDMNNPPPPPSPEKPVPIAPIIAALLPSIIEAIPKLGRVFGSGSEVAERNIKAAELVVETVKSATGAVNAQDAVERLRSDPGAAVAATAAIDRIWFELTEAGGGGVDGARKADAAQRQAGDLLHSASFWVGLMLVPLVYLLVLSLIGIIGTATWSDDVRAGLAGSLISAIIGGLVGYYFGQTTTRNRSAAP